MQYLGNHTMMCLLLSCHPGIKHRWDVAGQTQILRNTFELIMVDDNIENMILSFASRQRSSKWSVSCRYTAQLAYQCAIGFSGVIFGLIVVDNNISGATQRSIFGFFYVPAPLYPWVLMLLWQVIMPGVSFLGHLCGVLVSRQRLSW